MCIKKDIVTETEGTNSLYERFNWLDDKNLVPA